MSAGLLWETADPFTVTEEERAATQAWLVHARCYLEGVPPDEFFDEPTDRAWAACRACVVADECLAYALKHDMHGYMGGTTDRDRRRMQRSNERARDRDQDDASNPTCPGCRSSSYVVPASAHRHRCLNCGSSWPR